MRASSDREVLLDRILAASLEDVRLRAVWLEGPDAPTAREASRELDLHAAVEDPDLDEVWRGHDRFLSAVATVEDHADESAPVDAFACRARLEGGILVRFTVERASLLAKRRRRAIVPLLDRWGRLRFVLSYESAPAREADRR